MPEYRPLTDYQECARALDGLPAVEDTTVIEFDERIGAPAIEVLVGPGYERVPPAVGRKRAEYDFGTWDITSEQGSEGRYFVVVVV
jgi:hypothetical protein